MSLDRYTTPAGVDRDTVQSVSKLLLATLSLIGLLYLASLLPGIDRLVPGTPITFAAIASVVATVTVVGLLLFLAPALADLVRSTFDGPAGVVDDVASIVHLFVVLVAVLVAHRGLALAIVPLLEGGAWVYDVVFLALALPPLGILAARLYVSLDPIAELLADTVTRAESAPNGNTDEDAVATERGEH
ncbi:hypothetical protein [Halopiger aswanensis]|uniref:Uncharacterized protein n=1 Tax=Halopiger aswanensis TaxID=148449 RepID=A0A3R7EFE8_9EURY|nr:hypothetical protein [Halopiger aswanensis]RKD95484.1 hypothetical protein ATJ93_2340 [Halopiger aswanensis]